MVIRGISIELDWRRLAMAICPRLGHKNFVVGKKIQNPVTGPRQFPLISVHDRIRYIIQAVFEVSDETKEGAFGGHCEIGHLMYVIRAVGETCHIMDSEDRVRFVGDLWECEAWLDQQENLSPPARVAAPMPANHRFGLISLPRWLSLGAKQLSRTQ